MTRPLGRLQFKLLTWFLGSILLAIAASAVTAVLTRPESEPPSRVVSRHVLHRVARLWDDPAATEAYVAQVREDTGLELRVRRDPDAFARPGRMRPGAVVFEGGVAYVPVVRNGVVVGALELRTGMATPQPWRVVAALGAALLALGFVARRVSKRLALPLEHLAQTAERFGKGQLDARTGIERLPRRWVAEEVRDVGRAFDGMADRIARVVLDQRELLAAISHELRSPLGRARIALELARERGRDEAAVRPLDDVDRQLVEIDAILGDLLASARAGLADVRLLPTPLVPWLRERAAHEHAPVDVVAEASAETVTVALDGALLGRAMHNLFENARAHGHPEDRPVVVAVRLAGERVLVAVRDEGPGFAADVLPRAFDPFVAGRDRARTPGAHGMGLGLALVRRIVEAHGGTVSAQNLVRDDGRGPRAIGAELTVELPASRAAGLATPAPTL